ncbi:MAG: HAMP domain-containing histidine kinase [Bifidobacteriaceae bacterium]|jgi:signal transduction histidine kinase|nr:HAMP domain-containing histidine kinase [Bifidobacteriaceae bacterium]
MTLPGPTQAITSGGAGELAVSEARRDARGWWTVGWRLGLFWAALALGWLVAELVFWLAGRPPALLAYLIAATLAAAIGFAAVFLAAKLAGGPRRPGLRPGNAILEKLRRIGRGDLDVRLEGPGSGPVAEAAEPVNGTAREPVSPEQRQQDIISSVSREIQPPVASITGLAALLREPGLDVDTREHYLDVIVAECRHLSALGSSLSQLTASEDLEVRRRRFALDEQLRDVILTLEPRWSAKGVEVALESHVAQAEGDPDLLRQLWVSLIQNAIKFTPPGGRVVVRAGVRAPANAKEAAVQGAELATPGWRVEVQDTGVGIDPSDLPHVFERFFHADGAQPAAGEGLGLAVAKRIVDLHGGRITVTSSPRTGSMFTVILP